MRSKIDKYTLNEEHSRELFSKFCRLNSWKYRKMEWDNDIDGEIEIFDDSKQTTSKFIKIQLKTIDKVDLSNEQSLNFDADVKFLNFCDICDIPVVLVVFDIENEAGYFLFVQKYISEKLDSQNPEWRKNKSNVRLKIPRANHLNPVESKDHFINFGFEGINTITQLRKTETYKSYFTVLNQSDNSHGTALRTSVKVLIEKTFSTSKDALRILIPKINTGFIEDVYFSCELREKHFKNKKCQVIFLAFYNSLEQANHGLPFCNTLWVDSKLPENARPMNSEADEIIDEVNFYWQKNLGLSTSIEENQLSKGKYLPYLDRAFNQFFNLYGEIDLLFKNYLDSKFSFEKLIKRLKKYDRRLSDLNDLFHNFGFAPIECKDIDVQIKSLTCLLDNIRIVISDMTRTKDNVTACIKMYLKSIDEKIPEYRYERKKIK